MAVAHFCCPALILILVVFKITAGDDPYEVYRQKLRDYRRADLCLDWRVLHALGKPARSRANKECTRVLKEFAALPAPEKISICPRARYARCHRCSNTIRRCSFDCSPTAAEIQAAEARRQRARFTTKTLDQILDGIARYKDTVERQQRRQQRQQQLAVGGQQQGVPEQQQGAPGQ